MKNKFFTPFIMGLFLCLTGLYAQDNSPLQSIREDLFYSEFDLDKCFSFHKSITDLNDTSSIVVAYQAAAEALIAKHSWNPVSKFNYLHSSQKMLNRAILNDVDNIEIRFLRLYIESSIPAYLGMSKNKADDKKVIIDNIEKLPAMNLGADITNYIINYITSPQVSSADEIAMIRNKIDLTKPPSF